MTEKTEIIKETEIIKWLTVRLSPATFEILKKHADKRGLTKTAVVREIINDLPVLLAIQDKIKEGLYNQLLEKE